jgi:nitrogen fixation/metabolism regulation signal transduction histidine kinase
MNRLRTRTVLAALVVALLPAAPLSVLVSSLLERSFRSPLSAEVDEALEAALDASREQLRRDKKALARFASGEELPADAVRTPDVREAELRSDGSLRGELPGAVADWARAAARRDDGTARIGPERVGDHLVVLVSSDDGARVLAWPLDARMTETADKITGTLAMLRAWQLERSAVLRGYVLPFVLTYVLLLAVAAAIGGVLARRLARPVEALADAALRVGGGDLGTRVNIRAPGEVGQLVDAFNQMVDELETQRRELSRLERMAAWRDIARSLAHEIKNPLTPIQLAVQQLGDQAPGRADPEFVALLTECAEIVNEETDSLRRLVREFSEFARLPAPRPTPGDLSTLLGDLSRLYGERVTYHVRSSPLHARFDEAELRRALINLIDNGLAACREAGRPERVTLSATTNADVAIRAADEGCGIAPENRERIFEPNFSTKSEGMGLGLAIVAEIVRGHGGRIEVESEVGSGTTFTVHLPTAPAPAEEATS